MQVSLPAYNPLLVPYLCPLLSGVVLFVWTASAVRHAKLANICLFGVLTTCECDTINSL